MVVEQTLGQDGARASCIQVPSGSAHTSYGGCANVSGCPSGDLCFAWPQVSDSSCHVAAYSVGSDTLATRAEYAVPSTPGPGVPLAREEPVTLTLGTVTHTQPADDPNPNGWVRSLPVAISVAANHLANGPSQTLRLHPVATDPNGASAAITSGGNPC